MKKPLSKYPGVWLIAVFFCVMIYFQVRPYSKLEPLKGAIVTEKDTVFSVTGWLNENFQHQKEKYLNENFGFRSTLVRLHNQIQFSAFNVAFANGVVVGKNNFLYEMNYLKAVTGADFVGKDSIRHSVNRLKQVSELLNNDGIKMIVVLAPGKGSFYPEYIPDRFGKPAETTNYSEYRKALLNSGIPFIDFNYWFRAMKDTCSYPLFPKTGIHWSQYGVVLAVDSLTHYIEQITQTDLPDMEVTGIEYDNSIHQDDKDIEDGMNLLFSIPKYKLAYPQTVFHSEGKTKIPSITIADSYYWQIYGSGLAGQIFEPAQFWYYFERVYMTGVNGDWAISTVNIPEELRKQKVVLLISTDANLSRFDYGFSSKVIKEYTDITDPKVMQERIQKKINAILNTPQWLKEVERKAKEKHLSLDTMLYLDAQWVVEQEAAKVR